MRPKKGHHGHFFCGDRFCVPAFLFEEFDKQLGGADMERALTWMKQLDARASASGEIIEDPIRYVRDAFRESLRAYRRLGRVLSRN